MSKSDLQDFMRSVSWEMQHEYERIQKRVKEDPGTAGDQGEENWASLLRNWLPPIFQVVTKGRIVNPQGKTSPQLDVLVLKPEYPKYLLDKKLYLSGGVLAAFECKITLKTRHIADSMTTAIKIRSLLEPRLGTPYKEVHSGLIYGLLAHSHSWKSENSEPKKLIQDRIISEDKLQMTHPREMLDLICIADLATWSARKMTFLGAEQHDGRDYGAHTCHSQMPYEFMDQAKESTAIGAMVQSLLYKLAYEYPPLISIAEHFQSSMIEGPAFGILREWPSTIFSDLAKSDARERTEFERNKWSEWCQVFS